MKYSTALSFLLPATVLAKPTVDIRQPTPRAKFTGGFTATPGCGVATLTFDSMNEVANVILPDYRLSLPGQNQRICSLTLAVLFPPNSCTTGTAFGNATGRVTLPNGVQATFNGRDYAVSPTPGTVSQISPDERWTGPVNPTEFYELDDQVGYTLRPDSNNNLTSFTIQGQLQLQPSNGPSGFISNDRFTLDIRTQIPCCMLPAPCSRSQRTGGPRTDELQKQPQRRPVTSRRVDN